MPSGWLYLEAQKRKDWTSRFFVLDEGYLRYFISDDDLDPVATINVKGIEAKGVGQSRVGKYAFRLNVTKQSDGRYKYVLAGETESESKQWLTWLAEEGVSVPSMKLTAKKGKDDSGIGGFLSFRSTKSSKAPGSQSMKTGKSRKVKGDDEEEGGGLLSFLSFGGKKKPQPKPDLAAQGSGVGGTSARPPSGKHVSISEPNPPTLSKKESSIGPGGAMLQRQPSSVRQETPAHMRSMLMPAASVELMANEGLIDGDKPFNEMVAQMGRTSVVQSMERRMTASKSSSSLGDAIEKARSFSLLPTKEAEAEEDDGEESDDGAGPEPDDEAATGDVRLSMDTWDRPSSAEVTFTEGDGGAVAGGGVVGEASDEGDKPAPAPLTSRSSTEWGSMAGGLAAAEATQGAEPTSDDVSYGSNVTPRAPAAPADFGAATAALVEESEADAAALVSRAVETALEEVYPEVEEAPPTFMEQVRRLSTAAAQAFAPQPKAPTEETLAKTAAIDNALTEEDNALPPEEVAAKVAANVMALAIELAAPPRRPSLFARAVSVVKQEPPKPPPKPTFVDTPEEAVVRTWLKEVFLTADQPKLLNVISDNTITLRDHLRSGVVLCSALNCLKPGTVGRVKPPSATASRFARLEPLTTYKNACVSLGLGEKDCLPPAEWLDGKTMTPLLDHIPPLTRYVKGAPKLQGGERGGLKKAPTKANAATRGAAPGMTARDMFAEKKGAAAVVKPTSPTPASRAGAANRGAKSNAAAARAVFEIDKGTGPGTAVPIKSARERAASGAGKKTDQSQKMTVRTATGATHSFAESETIAFSDYINEALGDDNAIAHLLPIDEDSLALFDALKDGVILCKLINSAQADTIDMRCVHTGAKKPLSVYEVVENLNMAINAAVAIGCRVVNIGHDDVMSGSPHLVLGLLWQIVKAGIMAKINLKASPELMALLEGADDMESLKALMALPPEKILLKWVNFQVQRVAPGTKELTNFGPGLKDCSIYAHLLHAVAPPDQQHLVSGLSKSIAREPDAIAKAQLIIDTATQLGVTQFKLFPADITKGNEKLNMGFMAAIFNQLPGLVAPADHGTFSPPAPAGMSHPKVKCTQGNHTAKIEENGLAVMGAPMKPKTGKHWVEFRVLDASVPAGAHLGVVPEGLLSSDKAAVLGGAPGSIGIQGEGSITADGEVKHADAAGAFAMGDLVRVEYDSDAGVVTYLKNGDTLPHPPTQVKAGETFMFGLGRTAGVFEARIEGSSFVGSGEAMKLPMEDEGDSREERAFRMWINSLGIDTHVSDLPSQVRDGLLVLQLMDAIKPGVVDWAKVTKKPKNVHAKVINCNYAVQLGKTAFGFSLVGIQGKDLQDGIIKLVLALTWQLMRYHVIKFLSSVTGKSLTEKDVVDWANGKVGDTAAPITKLSDGSIASGIYILKLIKAIAPRAVSDEQITAGKTPEERKLNARLAVSCARKAGCMVFLLWEDITDCKPKMLLILFATLMQLDLAEQKKAEDAAEAAAE